MKTLNKMILAGSLSMVLMTSSSWAENGLGISIGPNCSGGLTGCDFAYLATEASTWKMTCNLRPTNGSIPLIDTEYEITVQGAPSSDTGKFEVLSKSFTNNEAEIIISYTPNKTLQADSGADTPALHTKVIIGGASINNKKVYTACTVLS